MTSACTLPCAQEGANCVLFGRRVLLLAERADDRDRLAAMLRLLGLEVLPAVPSRGGARTLPARIDLVVCASLAELRRAGDVVALLRHERPWVPLIAATTGGQAVLVDMDRPIDAPARSVGDLATLVVRAGCRVARHSRIVVVPSTAIRAPSPTG